MCIRDRPNPDQPLDPRLLDVYKRTEQELERSLFNDEVESSIRQKDKLTMADEINYICCNQILLRNIIENYNSSVTTEIKLDIGAHKLNITAFTKAIFGEHDILVKNAMSICNTINTSDLEHYCLFTSVDETQLANANIKKNDYTKSIIFKLKDLRNFMNIGSSLKVNPSDDDVISIWFCKPGDPILIETNRMGVRMQLVQITDSVTNTEYPVDGTKRITSPIKQARLQQEEAVFPEKAKKYSPSRSKRYANRSEASPQKDNRRQLFVEADSQVEKSSNNIFAPVYEHMDTYEENKLPIFNNPEDPSIARVNISRKRISSQEDGNSDVFHNKFAKDVSDNAANRSNTTIGWGKNQLDHLAYVKDGTRNTIDCLLYTSRCV